MGNEEERENPFLGEIWNLFAPAPRSFFLVLPRLVSVSPLVSSVCFLSSYSFSRLLSFSPSPLLPLWQSFSINVCVSNSDELLLQSPSTYFSIFIFFACIFFLFEPSLSSIISSFMNHHQYPHLLLLTKSITMDAPITWHFDSHGYVV